MEQEKLDWDALQTVTEKVLRYRPQPEGVSASRSAPPKEEPTKEEPDEDSSEPRSHLYNSQSNGQ